MCSAVVVLVEVSLHALNPSATPVFGGPAPAHLLADCWAGKARPRELQGSVEASRRDASNDTIYLIGPLRR